MIEKANFQSSKPVFSEEDRKDVSFAASKKLIYLDFNVWINFAERFQHTAAKCRQAESSRKILFPVSNATVLEVIEQPNKEQRAMSVMPSLDLYCRIMAERGINPSRKPEEQDFHDAEHAIIGSVYADVFVTSDRYLLDLLNHRCSIPKERGCKVVCGIEGLEDVLKEL